MDHKCVHNLEPPFSLVRFLLSQKTVFHICVVYIIVLQCFNLYTSLQQLFARRNKGIRCLIPCDGSLRPPLCPLSPALRSLHDLPRLLRVNRSTDLLPALSRSPLAADEAYALHHGDASSASPSASLRPKRRLALLCLRKTQQSYRMSALDYSVEILAQ